jgi:type VI protein secretion system component VasK
MRGGIGRRLLELAAIVLLLPAVVILVGWLLGMPERQLLVLGAVVALLLALGWGVYWLRKYLLARRQRRKEGEQGQQAPASVDRAQAIAQLGRDFNEALADLAEARRARGLPEEGEDGRGLPWILVIGPPGAGKSTILERADPGLQPVGRRLGGLAMPYGLWLSEEAVFLELAGRNLLQEEAHEEWLALLGLIRRHRRRRSIDAAVLVLAIDELVGASRDDQERLAIQLRDRLYELMERLDVRFPIHVALNRLDRIDGFVPYFSHISDEERGLAWGFDLEAPLGRVDTGQFVARWDTLADALQGRMAAHVTPTAQREEREAVLYFPDELRAHRDALAQFVGLVFKSRPNSEGLSSGGVYLMSAAPEGLAMPGVRDRATALLGVEAVAKVRGEMAEAPGGWFVRGALARVAHQAENAARPTLRQQRRMQWRRRVAVGVGALGAFGGGWFLAQRLQAERHWLAQLTAAAQLVEGTSREAIKPATPDAFDALSQRVEALLGLQEILQARKAGGLLRVAHRAGADVLYRNVEAQLLAPLSPILEKELSAGEEWTQESADERFARGYRALQAAFILERRPCPSAPKDQGRRWLAEYLANLWRRQVTTPTAALVVSESRLRRTQDHLQELLSFHFTRYLDPGGTGRTTRLAVREGLQESALRALRQGSGVSAPILTFNLITSMTGTYAEEPVLESPLLADQGLATVFMGSGCRQLFSVLERQENKWWSCVFGEDAEGSEALQAMRASTSWAGVREVANYYLGQYRRAWNSWFDTLHLREPAGGAQGKPLARLLERLEHLGRPQGGSTLHRFFDEVLAHAVGAPTSTAEEATGTPQKSTGCARVRQKLPIRRMQAEEYPACHQAQAMFQPFAMVLGRDGGGEKGEPQEAAKLLAQSFQSYLEKAQALAQQIRKMEDSSAAAAQDQALTLVLSTMRGEGALRELGRTREEFIKALEKPPKDANGAPGLRLDGLNRALEALETELWRVLVDLSRRALEAQWLPLQQEWKALQARVESDPNTCPQLLETARSRVLPYVEQKITPFLDVTMCKPLLPAAPFEDYPVLLARNACTPLQQLRSAVARGCPSSGGGAPQGPVPVHALQVSQATCEDPLEGLRIDTGLAVYDCPLPSGDCRAQMAVPTSGSAVLSIARAGEEMKPVWRKATLGQASGSKRHIFFIPAQKMGGACPAELEVEFAAPPSSGGGAGGKSWRVVALPRRLTG